MHLTGRRRYDCAIVSRPHNWPKVIEDLRRFQPTAPVIYDAEALWHARLQTQLRYALPTLKSKLQHDFHDYVNIEQTIARQADHIVAISEAEADFFACARRSDQAVTYMPPLPRTKIPQTTVAPGQRKHALFVAGWLAGPNSPNGDGLTWFTRNILPLVVDEIPWVRVLVTGGMVPPDISSLAGPNLVFLGHVTDLNAAHNSARIAIVPIRYGAGVKLKTIDALLNAVPLVSTSVGVEGVPLLKRDDIDVADDASTFASAMSRLLVDDDYWMQKRAALLRLNDEWSKLPVPSWPDIVRAQVRQRNLRTAP